MANDGATAALSLFCIACFLFGMYALCKAEGYHRRWKKKMQFMRFNPRASRHDSESSGSSAAEQYEEPEVLRLGITPLPAIAAAAAHISRDMATPPPPEEEMDAKSDALLLEEGTMRSDAEMLTRGSSLWSLPPNTSDTDRRQSARDYLLAKARPSPAAPLVSPDLGLATPEPSEEEELSASPDPPPPLSSLRSPQFRDDRVSSPRAQALAAQQRAPGSWVKCLYYTNGPYKPTPHAVGTLAPHNNATSPAGLAKLSDEEINGIPPHTDGCYYYKLTCEPAPGLLNNTIFVRTTRPFVDSDPAFGWGGAEYHGTVGTVLHAYIHNNQ
jgi:hypothetical protein